MGRYLAASADLNELLNRVRSEHFEYLANAKIMCLFDAEKRKSGDFLVFAKIMRTNDLIRHLTQDIADDVDGMDYIIVVDQILWSIMEEADKRRVLRHELCHATYNADAKSPYGLRDHTVQDFYEEIERNQDDPRWKQRLALLLENEYIIRANTMRHQQMQQPADIQMEIFEEEGRQDGGEEDILVDDAA